MSKRAAAAAAAAEATESSEDDTEERQSSDDDEEVVHKGKKSRKNEKRQDPGDEILRAAAAHLHLEPDILRDVPKRWVERQVLLTPALWVYMFSMHPPSYDDFRSPTTHIDGDLARQIRAILEERFPSAASRPSAALSITL